MLLHVFLSAFLLFSAQPVGHLHLRIENVTSPRGQILVGLYADPELWLDEEGEEREFVFPLRDRTDSLRHAMEDLPYGTYAVAVFHDINGNGKMDKNLVGLPTEPYAFSNNPKVKWREPKFEDAHFDFTKDQQEIVMVLKYWKEH